MALTKSQRDALPSEDFAVPGKRQLPIHDETHVKMAWDQVSHTKGLSDAERSEAHRRILERAKKLGIDTKNWRVSAMAWDVESLEAMSLETPSTPDHPNKMPFSGILVRLDQPSNEPPHGAFGKRIILTRAAAEAALPSLLGMAVNYTPELNGHDRKAKIGVIDAATIETDAQGDYVHIGGFMYASDFPEVTSRIQKDKKDLGFSFEAARIFLSDKEVNGCLEIKELTFTGAAVLQKSTAAYQSTSIAASAAREKEKVEKEQFDQIMAGLTSLTDRVTKIEAGQTASMQAASVLDKVKKHTDGLRKVADGMAAAGIGGHPTRGHVHILNHMADSMDAAACKGEMAASYNPPSMYASGANDGDSPAKKELDEIKASLATLTNTLKEVKAAAEAKPSAGAPERKTVAPAIERLLAKASITLPEGDGKMTVAALDEVLAKSKLEPNQRIELKVGLRNAGLLAAA